MANIGDTRAVLRRSGKAERLTFDHKATEPTEVERVKNSGGMIFRDRVSGMLAVTRAFGDIDLKDFGLCAVPYQTTTKLTEDVEVVVIACDGVSVSAVVEKETEVVLFLRRTPSSPSVSFGMLPRIKQLLIFVWENNRHKRWPKSY
jgi:serine/threonine protein phosphatase PrpC